jgi:hypothetical protein
MIRMRFEPGHSRDYRRLALVLRQRSTRGCRRYLVAYKSEAQAKAELALETRLHLRFRLVRDRPASVEKHKGLHTGSRDFEKIHPPYRTIILRS